MGGRAEPREHECSLGRFARQMDTKEGPGLQAARSLFRIRLVLPCSKIIPQIPALYTIYCRKSFSGGCPGAAFFIKL